MTNIDEEDFLMRWHDYGKSLSAGFSELLSDGSFSDVTLAAEGQLLKVHRLILSVCSPYFRQMFSQIPVNQHAFVVLKEISCDTLKDLVQFMYRGEVNVKANALPTFLSAARSLQVRSLMESDTETNSHQAYTIKHASALKTSKVATPAPSNAVSTKPQTKPGVPNISCNKAVPSEQTKKRIGNTPVDVTQLTPKRTKSSLATTSESSVLKRSNVPKVSVEQLKEAAEFAADVPELSCSGSTWDADVVCIDDDDDDEMSTTSDESEVSRSNDIRKRSTISYQKTNRDGVVLMYEGKKYYKNHVNLDGSIGWRCMNRSKLKCPSSINTKKSKNVNGKEMFKVVFPHSELCLRTNYIKKAYTKENGWKPVDSSDSTDED